MKARTEAGACLKTREYGALRNLGVQLYDIELCESSYTIHPSQATVHEKVRALRVRTCRGSPSQELPTMHQHSQDLPEPEAAGRKDKVLGAGGYAHCAV